MGSGISRTGSAYSHRTQAVRGRRRRATVKHTISSFLPCGASSISRLANLVENGHSKKMKFSRNKSNISSGKTNDLIKINTESMVSSGRHIVPNENHTPNIGAREVGHENKGKCLSVNVHSVPSHQSIENSRENDTASTSYLNQLSPYSVPRNGVSEMDSTNGENCKMNPDSPEIEQGLDKSSTAHSPCHGEPLLDEVSVENNASSDQVYFSNSDHSYASSVSGSPLDHHLQREDSLQEVTPSFSNIAIEQNQHDESSLQVDLVSLSSNVFPTSSTETITGGVRRNSRRIFWDAFSRHSPRNHRESRIFVLSPGNSGPLIPQDSFLDLTGGFHNDETDGNSRSLGNRSPSSNEQHWNSTPEDWETLRGRQGFTHLGTGVCPAGIHSDGSCSCASSSAEDSGTRGVSRIVMLAEALFEVLDQIHQHPLSLTLSVVSLPAPESVVDSFPVKTHSQAERLASAEDVSQCYICLAEYEEGDKIRVLPCHHEFHMTCVDKWLKEVHGVCPLCRGHIGEGST